MSKKNEFFRTVKYALIAASAGLIQFGSYTLFLEVCKFNIWFSYLVSLVLSVVWNFTINRRYTFKSANNVPKAMLLVLAYYLVFTPLSLYFVAYLSDGLILDIQLENHCNWNAYLVFVINLVINGVTEFLYQRFVVFGKTIDTNSVAKKKATKPEEVDAVSNDNN